VGGLTLPIDTADQAVCPAGYSISSANFYVAIIKHKEAIK